MKQLETSPEYKEIFESFIAHGNHACNPFDEDRDNKLLVSFSTGFTSTANDAVNAQRAAEVDR